MIQASIRAEAPTVADLDIFDDIGEYTERHTDTVKGHGANTVSKFLNENKGVETVNVRIQSNGGDAFEGIAILNLLKNSGKTVNVEIVGIAASAASVIAMAGNTVRMNPTSQLMIHNPWTIAFGNADEIEKTVGALRQCAKSIRIAYMEKAGDKLTEDKLIELLDAESYLTADECLALGLCDEIIGKEKEAPKDEQEEPVKDESKEIEAKAKPADSLGDMKPVNKLIRFF